MHPELFPIDRHASKVRMRRDHWAINVNTYFSAIYIGIMENV